jgi:hypothetical protein
MLIDGHHIVGTIRLRNVHPIEIDALPAAAVATPLFAASLFDQDPPHRLGGRSEEVAAIGELIARSASEGWLFILACASG